MKIKSIENLMHEKTVPTKICMSTVCLLHILQLIHFDHHFSSSNYPIQHPSEIYPSSTAYMYTGSLAWCGMHTSMTCVSSIKTLISGKNRVSLGVKWRVTITSNSNGSRMSVRTGSSPSCTRLSLRTHRQELTPFVTIAGLGNHTES